MMRCARCRGLMVTGFYGERVNEGMEGPGVWRCVNCGELVDLQVLHNRMESHAQLRQLVDLKQHQTLQVPRLSLAINTGAGVQQKKVGASR